MNDKPGLLAVAMEKVKDEKTGEKTLKGLPFVVPGGREYGNQGLDFKGVAKEGFGWVNASYVYGLQIVNAHMRRALGTLTPYDTFVKALEQMEEKHLAELS
ncbi:hypothetical protein BN1723_001239 [Verticillium longisporum]|uniref:Uncharacterized protein n=1 Tax=Verticillium longisporum TaxID=100787 RepID=A0A0G4NKK3_VERLO|nr:hypothetical protein BN1723_001239 [Verticillium longisporum]